MLSFFPCDVLDEIWDLIESVSEGFPTYFWLYSHTRCYTLSSKAIGHLIMEKKIFKVFTIHERCGHVGHVTRAV